MTYSHLYRVNAYPETGGDNDQPGMLLRDWFAGKIAPVLLAEDLTLDANEFAESVYLYADALTEEALKGRHL